MEEYVNETNEELENQEQECAETCVKEAAHTENKSKYKNTGLLKASVALMFASSMLSAGVTGYQILAGGKDNDDSSQKPQSTIGTVSDKKDTAPYISEDGYWVIDGVKTQFKAEGVNGSNGSDGIDGEDGTDGIYVKQARVVYNDKWNISSYIMFVMSDDTYITTNVQINVMNDHYYEASNAEDVVILVETYGVSKIRLVNDITLTSKLNVENRLNIDLDENTFTYSAIAPMSVKEGARLVVENGTFNIKSNTGVCLAEADSRLTFEEVNIKAKATVAEVLGTDARIALKNSSVETVENNGNGYTAARSVAGSLFKVYGENANIEVRETAISTTLNIFAVDSLAKTVDINVKDCEVVSTAHFLDIDTSAVVPTLSLDDETMESSTLAGFATAPVVSGNFNFNPEYAGLVETAFNVNGRWFVAEDFADLIARVESGASIDLTEDVELNTAVVIDKTITLNLNGFNISLPTDTAGDGVFKIVEGGKLTINGEGVINGVGNNDYSMAIWVNGGECVINGGTYTNEGAGVEDHYDLIYVKGGKLTINGGTFKGQTPAWLVNTHDGHRDTSTIVITGGTFYGFNPANNATENEGTNYVANGYIVVERDGVYTIEESLAHAMSDETVTSVTLAGDMEIETAIVIDSEIELNLNGFDISLPNDTAGDGVFRIVAGGNLTINGEGVINGVGNNNYNMAIWVNGGACTINGGTYTNVGATDSTDDDAHFDVIYVKGGSLTVNGGEFFGETPAWLINTNDGYRNSSTITVKGGVFHGFNPANNATENAGTNYVANGYKVVENKGIYTVVESEGNVYVSSVEEFNAALADASVKTITLAKDLDFGTAVVIDRTIVLELNEKTLTVKNDTAGDGVFRIVAGGNLTINGEGVINGVGNNNYNMAIWVNGGECVINGGTYTNEGAGTEDHYDLIYVKGGKLTINGGTFKGQTPAWLVNTHDGHRDTSTIAITGGTFYGFNPANNATENDGTNYVAEGHIVTRSGNVYVVSAE